MNLLRKIALAAGLVGLIAVAGAGGASAASPDAHRTAVAAATAYLCIPNYCTDIQNTARGNTQGFAVIHGWKGTGPVYAKGNYDSLLIYPQNTYFTFHWANAQGWYVGIHYRVRVIGVEPSGVEHDLGTLNRGQYHNTHPTWTFYARSVTYCGC